MTWCRRSTRTGARPASAASPGTASSVELAQGTPNDIAASGSLWHSDLGGWIASPWMAGWRSLGENLAQVDPGSNAWGVEDMWMASAPHRANILNGGFNRIGVGVGIDGAGRIWMVALFGTR